MTPYYADDWLTVYYGDARRVLSGLDAESVHCVVTSPPYWGLRDYGEPGQLGLEPTPEAYVESLVAVFREVRRVLRSDGTVWLNLGDSYSLNQRAGAPKTGSYAPERPGWPDTLHGRSVAPGLKPKDLVGIPWMVAFALRADGWYLRSDIIWAKPNPMPESVTDRPTKSHEYLFLLSKSSRYYFDADAVATDAIEGGKLRIGPIYGAPASAFGVAKKTGNMADDAVWTTPTRANIRSVWTVATQPYPGAHFATFPPKLIEPCIKAGTSERGVCSICGAPWQRILGGESSWERRKANGDPIRYGLDGQTRKMHGSFADAADRAAGGLGVPAARQTMGWKAGCPHRVSDGAEIIPATVLDPFAGSGTTGMVAQSLSRRAVLIDLSMDYLGQLMDRNRDIPLGLGA